MGAYVDLSEPFWDLRADVAPNPKDVEENLRRLGALSRVQLAQRARPRVHPALVRVLRERVFAVRPDLGLRVYGGSALDLSFLEELPKIQSLTIEVTKRLDAVAALARPRGLRKLSLTLPKGVDPALLAHVPATVEELSLRPDDGKPSNLDLGPLLGLDALTALHLEGYECDLPALLPRLKRLRRLTLRSIKNMPSLDPIAGSSALRSVRVLLGGIHRLDVLGQLPRIRHLALWRIAKLGGVDFISRMRGLESLYLETLSEVTAFPAAKELGKLRVVKLAAMKRLRDFASLERAPSLEEFVFQNAAHQRPDDFVPVLRNRRLKRGGFGFAKKDDVRRMTELLTKYGVDGEVYMFPQVRGRFPGFNAE